MEAILQTTFSFSVKNIYRKVTNIRRSLLGNKLGDHSDVVGASAVGAAPITYSFSTKHMASMDWTKTTARRDEEIWQYVFFKLESH